MTAYTWGYAGSGDWSTQADWTPVGLPGTADDVTLGAIGVSYTVTVSEAEEASSLALGAATAALSIDSSTLTVAGTVGINAGTLFNSFGRNAAGYHAAAGQQLYRHYRIRRPGERAGERPWRAVEHRGQPFGNRREQRLLREPDGGKRRLRNCRQPE